MTAGQWNQIDWVRDGDAVQLYVNGVDTPVSVRTGSTAIAAGDSLNTSADLYFGKRASGGSPFPWDGQQDEVRLSSTARSADWIATEYNNQNSPDTFFTVGSENSWLGGWVPGWHHDRSHQDR